MGDSIDLEAIRAAAARREPDERVTPSNGSDLFPTLTVPAKIDPKVPVAGPDQKAARQALRAIDDDRGGRACAGRYTVEIGGMPITGWCAEPLCVNTHACTGPRFVPHLDQYTVAEGEPGRKLVEHKPDVLVEASRLMALEAAKETGRPDERSRTAVARHIGLTWRKLRAAIGRTGPHTRPSGVWTPRSH